MIRRCVNISVVVWIGFNSPVNLLKIGDKISQFIFFTSNLISATISQTAEISKIALLSPNHLKLELIDELVFDGLSAFSFSL